MPSLHAPRRAPRRAGRRLTRRLQLAGGVRKEEILTCGRPTGRPQLKRKPLAGARSPTLIGAQQQLNRWVLTLTPPVEGLGGELLCTAPHRHPTAASGRRAASEITLPASMHHAVGPVTRAGAPAARQTDQEPQRAF